MSTTLRPVPPPVSLAAPAFPRVPSTRPATGGVATRGRTRSANEGWTTPRVLQALLLASLLAAILLFIAGFAAHNALKQDVQSVGRDSVPSILAAQQIRASLVDMDASAANDLLAGPGGSRTARDSYNAERSLIGRQVAVAAQNITYCNLERIPIETLQDGMTYYAGLVAQAQQQIRDGNGDNTRATYTQATNYLHDTLVPASERLDAVNTAYLNRAYADVGGTSVQSTALVILAGLLLLAALVGAQLFLSRRTRRTLNLPLLAATVILIVFLANVLGIVSAVRGDLKTAKADAFDSVASLANARALVYDANGDQTKALLDKANAARYQMQFTQKTQGTDTTEGIVNQPITPQLLQEAQSVADSHVANPGSSRKVSFKGYLADEINNITFGQPERDAAIAALTEFGNYQQADKQIRDLTVQGKDADALALATGTNTDQAHRASERFDIALVSAINVNRSAFDDAVTRAFADVAPLQWEAPAAAFLIGLLAFFGLQPRLREYAV